MVQSALGSSTDELGAEWWEAQCRPAAHPAVTRTQMNLLSVSESVFRSLLCLCKCYTSQKWHNAPKCLDDLFEFLYLFTLWLLQME